MEFRILSLLGLALAAGCATTANPSNLQPAGASVLESQQTPQNYPSNYPPPMTSLSQPPPPQPPPREFAPPPPPPMLMSTQGWFGISYVDTRDVDLDSSAGNINSIDVDSANMPVIGGAFMKPLGGNRVQLGIEGGLNMGWLGNVSAVATGNGGVVVAADTDVFLFDLFTGPYVALNVNPRTRLYFAAGVVLEWASFAYDVGANNIYEDGFGDGVYARTGFEIQIAPGSWFGFGLRRCDTSLDPGGKIDSVELRQTQYLITVTHSM